MSPTPFELAAQSQLHTQQLAACKADVWRLLQRLPGTDMAAALREQVAAAAPWHVFHPINELGRRQHILALLQAAAERSSRLIRALLTGSELQSAIGVFCPLPR